jgi:hypothetical protein
MATLLKGGLLGDYTVASDDTTVTNYLEGLPELYAAPHDACASLDEATELWWVSFPAYKHVAELTGLSWA